MSKEERDEHAERDLAAARYVELVDENGQKRVVVGTGTDGWTLYLFDKIGKVVAILYVAKGDPTKVQIGEDGGVWGDIAVLTDTMHLDLYNAEKKLLSSLALGNLRQPMELRNAEDSKQVVIHVGAANLEFLLYDEWGNKRASLALGKNGGCLRRFDEGGKQVSSAPWSAGNSGLVSCTGLGVEEPQESRGIEYCPSPPSGNEFAIQDARGNLLATLDMLKGWHEVRGTPCVTSGFLKDRDAMNLWGEKGDLLATLGVLEDEHVLYLWDKKGQVCAVLALEKGRPTLGLWDEKGNLLVTVGMHKEPPNLALYDEDGNRCGAPRRFGLGALQVVEPLALYDGTSICPIVQLSAEMQIPALALRDENGACRLMLSVYTEMRMGNDGLYDGKGDLVALLREGPKLVLCGEKDEDRVVLDLDGERPALATWDENGAAPSALKDGVQLVLWHEKGKVIWPAPRRG